MNEKATLNNRDITHDRQAVPDGAWCYPPHQDEAWRLTDSAHNNWMGTVDDYSGNEVVDLSEWASENFADAFVFAQRVVQSYNLTRFGLALIDY